MEQMNNFNWAHEKIMEFAKGVEQEKHIESQRPVLRTSRENRSQRRERERLERRTAKRETQSAD